MMTNYSENVLDIFYRRRDARGEWAGGAMYYLRDGLGAKKGCKGIGRFLGVLFSVFCVLASFGIGNMSQINTIVTNITSVFRIDALSDIVLYTDSGTGVGVALYMLIVGLVVMAVAALVIIGGIKRIATVTEKIVPFMVVLYILGAVGIIAVNFSDVLPAFGSIFRYAFGVKAVAGGRCRHRDEGSGHLGFQARRLFQRGGARLLGDGPFRLQRKGAGPAGHVGHF